MGTDEVNLDGPVIEKLTETNENEVIPIEVDFRSEAEVARKILDNLIRSSTSVSDAATHGSDSRTAESITESWTSHHVGHVEPPLPIKKDGIVGNKVGKGSEAEVQELGKRDKDLDRTIFISNLPFEIDSEEVKERFSSFGKVQSFFPVLHKLTKYVKIYISDFVVYVLPVYLITKKYVCFYMSYMEHTILYILYS